MSNLVLANKLPTFLQNIYNKVLAQIEYMFYKYVAYGTQNIYL